MKKARFTTERIIAIRREHAAGAEPADLMRRHSIPRQTLYSCKRQCGNLQVPEARRLKALEEEHPRLKRLVADQALNLQILKDVLVRGS